MHDPWRYMLPCGHHSYTSYPNNPPERHFYCNACDTYHEKGALIDKKRESTVGVL